MSSWRSVFWEVVASWLEVRKDLGTDCRIRKDRPFMATKLRSHHTPLCLSVRWTLQGEFSVEGGLCPCCYHSWAPCDLPSVSAQAATCPATLRPLCWTSTTSQGHPCRGEKPPFPWPFLYGLPIYCITVSHSFCCYFSVLQKLHIWLNLR